MQGLDTCPKDGESYIVHSASNFIGAQGNTLIMCVYMCMQHMLHGQVSLLHDPFEVFSELRILAFAKVCSLSRTREHGVLRGVWLDIICSCRQNRSTVRIICKCAALN